MTHGITGHTPTGYACGSRYIASPALDAQTRTTEAPMARPRPLPHAPITEALIDIHVVPRDHLTFARLKEAIESVQFGYYFKAPIAENTIAWTIVPDQQPAQTLAESTQIGVRWHSIDERYVVQFRLSGFTLSRLPPYETWSDLSHEARRIWRMYVELLAPRRVVRVATRFINKLNLPMDNGVSFQEFLNKVVDVPSEAPQAVDTFFQRFQLADVATGDRVVLTLAMENMIAGLPVPVILDVDAFAIVDLPSDDDGIWKLLDRLRILKNRSFFGTITERAAELYE